MNTVCRLRIFGEIHKPDAIRNLYKIPRGSTFDTDSRWILVDTPTCEFPQIDPILLMTTDDVQAAASLTYEVRGWAHMRMADSTILGPNDFNIDIRTSTVVHFYGVLDVPVSSIRTFLEKDLPEIVAESRYVTDRIGLRASNCVARIEVPRDSYASSLTAIHEFLPHTYACCHKSQSIILVEDMQLSTYLILQDRDSRHHVDESTWYKHWQACQTYRVLVQHAISLSEDAKPILAEATNLSSSSFSRHDIALTGEIRSNLLDIRDRLSMFTLMTRTAKSFREQLDINAWFMGEDSSPAPAFEEDFQSWVLEDERRMYALPLERVEKAIHGLVDAADSRLDSLDARQQAFFNYSVQNRLIVLQWITLILAIVSLVVAIVPLLVDNR